MPEARQLNPLTRAVLLATALLVFGLVFRQLATLMIAVLMTVLVAIPLGAVADRLERYRVPRALGALAGLLIGFGVIAAMLALVIPSFVDQADEFVAKVPGTIDDLRSSLDDASDSDWGQEAQDFLERYTSDPAEFIGPLASIGLGVAGILAGMALILITAFFMAVRPKPLLDGVTSLFPPVRRDWARHVMARLRQAWVGWMEGVLIDMLITFVLVYLGLELIGVDLAIFFALVSAILVVIPYFGAILGAIPPVLFALADAPEKALLTLGIYVLIQQIEGNLTIPLVMANRVRLHPAVVAIGVVVIGQLFGFLGLFVAVPVLSMVVILVDEVYVKPMESGQGLKVAEGADVAREAEREPESEFDGGAVVITPPKAPPDPASEAPSAPRAS